jgi:hypothetical protein
MKNIVRVAPIEVSSGTFIATVAMIAAAAELAMPDPVMAKSSRRQPPLPFNQPSKMNPVRV